MEALNPEWSAEVGPYSPGPVAPSGLFPPIVVTVAPGNDLEQDILMAGSAQPVAQPQSTWTVPAAVPAGGDWVGSLSGYGDTDYLMLAAQLRRIRHGHVDRCATCGVRTSQRLCCSRESSLRDRLC